MGTAHDPCVTAIATGVQAGVGLWAPWPPCSLYIGICAKVITTTVRKSNEEMKAGFRWHRFALRV